jgi:diadenosine tetraphosphate (Ap4A) HIT family hydrolase
MKTKQKTAEQVDLAVYYGRYIAKILDKLLAIPTGSHVHTHLVA